MSCFFVTLCQLCRTWIPRKRKTIYERAVTWCHFAVHDGTSKRDAAKEFGIPLTTLIRRLRNPFPSPAGNPTAFTQDQEALFCGAGTTDVTCQAVVSYCILALPLSYVWVSRFRIWKLHYIVTCSDYFPSQNLIYLCGSFFKLKWTILDLLSIHVNRIESPTGNVYRLLLHVYCVNMFMMLKGHPTNTKSSARLHVQSWWLRVR